jgi:hypothetical protein
MKDVRSIVLIRHAEKPPSVGPPFGVDESGVIDQHNLTVKGWQRAGALVQMLISGRPDFALTRPTALFATAASERSPSTRCFSTLKPLALMLKLSIDDSFEKGREDDLALELARHAGTVVVAWEHKALPTLARAITGTASDLPPLWPHDRFDVAWVIARDSSGATRFAQIPQLLLDSDSCDGIPL